MVRRMSSLLLLVPALSVNAFELVVADATRDALYRMVDADGSGHIEAVEAVEIYADAAAGPDLSTPADLMIVGDVLYLLDGGTLDAILSFTDRDADGAYVGADEVAIVYNNDCPGPRLRTPNRLVYHDSVFAVVDDSRVKAHVTLLQDLDGDGAACAAGESLLLYDAEAAGVETPPTDPEALCVLADSSVVIGDAATGVLYRLVDQNQDGSVNGPDEIRAYYTPAAAVMPHFSSLVPYGAGVLAADRANGLVMYLEDRNEDAVIDADEVTLFCGQSAGTPLIVEPSDLWLDEENHLWLVDNGTDQILFLADRNGDGDALDPGEALVVLSDADILSRPTSLVVVAGPAGPVPQIEALSGTEGSSLGGDEIVITGKDFVVGSAVFFGDAPALTVDFLDGETLRVTTPPGSGTVSVIVASVTGRVVAPDAWTYAGEPLVVNRLSPAAGPAAGGFPVEVHGRGLDSAEAWFDGVAADTVTREPDCLVVTAPPHEPGEISVLVTNGVEEITLPFVYQEGSSFVRGDVDGNGSVNIGDAIHILQGLFANGHMPACLDWADANDDGSVNIADAIYLLSYLFVSGPAPAAPFPDPALDPTPDDLPCP